MLRKEPATLLIRPAPILPLIGGGQLLDFSLSSIRPCGLPQPEFLLSTLRLRCLACLFAALVVRDPHRCRILEAAALLGRNAEAAFMSGLAVAAAQGSLRVPNRADPGIQFHRLRLDGCHCLGAENSAPAVKRFLADPPVDQWIA
jgi:hypothetical protein